MRYLYESHLGGIYTSDREYDYNDLYCETCGDSDRYLGEFETLQEFWDLIKDDCSIDGSGGYALEYIYPIIVYEFNLPYEVHYKDNFEQDSGFCCNPEEEILTNINFELKNR